LTDNASTSLQSFAKVKQLVGMQRIFVEHKAALDNGTRFVRIEWKGPTELDRVEFEYGGSH
jgi:hypothetical protein